MSKFNFTVIITTAQKSGGKQKGKKKEEGDSDGSPHTKPTQMEQVIRKKKKEKN